MLVKKIATKGSVRKKVNMNSFNIQRNHMVHIYKRPVDLMSRFRGAVFLDRDGVLIEDVNYISSISDIKLVKGIKELLEFLTISGINLLSLKSPPPITFPALTDPQLVKFLLML